jgi:polyhydroxyalkanoate synthase
VSGRNLNKGDMTGAEMTDPELEELADRAAPLDILLVDAALGPMRRLSPSSSTVRFAARLARHPLHTGRRLG